MEHSKTTVNYTKHAASTFPILLARHMGPGSQAELGRCKQEEVCEASTKKKKKRRKKKQKKKKQKKNKKKKRYLAEDSTIQLMQLLVFFLQPSQSNLCHH